MRFPLFLSWLQWKAKWLRWKLVTERAELDRYQAEHRQTQTLEFEENSYSNHFEIAFDTDATPKQYSHIAYAYPSGALCGTKLLWFHGGRLTERTLREVNCPVCLHLWEKRALTLV